MSSHRRLRRQHPLDAGMHAGNRLALHTDPYSSFQALLKDLDAATERLTIQLYMLRDDPVGQAFTRALARACQRGVAVRLTLDGVGSMGLSRRMDAELRAAGVQLGWFALPGLGLALRRWGRRDHRKIVLVDGRIAWIQGMNVTTDYYSLEPGKPCWADAAVRAEGPLVTQVAAELHDPGVAAPHPPPGTALATAAFNRGGPTRAEVHLRYLQAVRTSKRAVRLAQAYFLPQRAMLRALGEAAVAGRDVRVVVPALADVDILLVALASQHAIGGLLARGVRVWELRGRMMHAKVGTVDGHWWSVGSANLDPLSRLRNLEANVVGLGEEQAAPLSAYIEALCDEGRELTLAEWRHRPLWLRALGFVAWWLRDFL